MVAIIVEVDVTFDHSSLNVNIQQSSYVDVNDNLVSLLIKRWLSRSSQHRILVKKTFFFQL